jgi:23S rRNA (adenine2030-N6)-methyltransferase
MNYQHAYHAGNFADVVKHAIFCRVLVHLREKPAPFRVIDTHAGAGGYNLAGPEAIKTQEWQDGVGRLLPADLAAQSADAGPQAADLGPQAADLLAPYLDAVVALNPNGRLAAYPGSPKLAQALLRRQDRLIACELEPRAAADLEHTLKGDARAKAIAIDGWTALTAYVPPRERRGVVLIDPPFEQPDEFVRLPERLVAAHRKWPTGIYLLWYPIKDDAEVAAFVGKLAGSGIAKMLRAELILPTAGPVASLASDMRPGSSSGLTPRPGLRGSGLIAVNPPWTLYRELEVLLPVLAGLLSRGPAGTMTLHWLAGESAS